MSCYPLAPRRTSHSAVAQEDAFERAAALGRAFAAEDLAQRAQQEADKLRARLQQLEQVRPHAAPQQAQPRRTSWTQQDSPVTRPLCRARRRASAT